MVINMSELTNEYKLSCYRKIKAFGENDTIWLAVNSVTGRQCVMRKQPMAQREVYERLLTIRHPHIVEILDVILQDGFLYVVEEYISGRLLSDMLSEKRVSRRFCLKAGEHILQALAALHESRIIHRDVKPENIVVDDRGSCKLIDFDIARIYVPEKERDTSMKGTRAYAPPEQFGFGQTDARADIYAFGVTMNVLATGCFPAQKLCGGGLGRVIRRCVEFDPGRRYQNVKQIVRRIRLLQGERMAALAGVPVILGLLLIMAISGLRRAHAFQDLADAPRSDRIIRLGGRQNTEEYPALLLAQDGETRFYVEWNASDKAEVYVEKRGEQLELTVSDKDRAEAAFSFADILAKDGAWEGAFDIDPQETEAEYELLLHDMDQDGTEDMVIALSRRERVVAPNPEDSFYLTAYTILWTVYLDDKQTYACTEPLFFSGMPTLAADGILQDDGTREWIGLENGIWKLY